ncbi:MAG: LpxL/LpxP family Kdo(2)-lipid IV(A) lauroyl/palmitoleoyl acyltransferase [Gammaproteobacteria bacterium]
MKFALLLMKLIGKLPYGAILTLGKWFGLLMLKVAKSRRDIAARNIALCFPELSDSEQTALLRKNFISTGQGLLETAHVWNVSGSRLKTIAQLHGEEHLLNAKESGSGVILLAFHLTSLELGGNTLANYHPMAAMYRQHRNPDFEAAMTHGREQHVTHMIEREDVRNMLRALKKGETIWYAADQDYGAAHSVFAPFFGIDAATITATSRFAKMTKAKVVPMTHYRDLANKKFHIRIYPEIADFASLDELQGAQKINHFLETYLREHPEDYMWLHRRFKTRPEGQAKLYAPKSILKMRRMLDSHYAKFMSGAEVLRGSLEKPEHIRLANGSEMRFYYDRRWYQKSPAKQDALAWQNSGQQDMVIQQLFYYPDKNAEVMHFISENADN